MHSEPLPKIIMPTGWPASLRLTYRSIQQRFAPRKNPSWTAPGRRSACHDGARLLECGGGSGVPRVRAETRRRNLEFAFESAVESRLGFVSDLGGDFGNAAVA